MTYVAGERVDRFELTADHVKLLRRAYVRWEDVETGAPAIDGKRPYGNSDVPRDVAEILGWDTDDGLLTNDQHQEAMRLHYETEAALQIVLRTGSFEPGIYVSPSFGEWERV